LNPVVIAHIAKRRFGLLVEALGDKINILFVSTFLEKIYRGMKSGFIRRVSILTFKE